MLSTSSKQKTIKDAREGDKVAQYRLGLWYRDGLVVAGRDPMQAYRWLTQSAEQGYYEALRPAAEAIVEYSFIEPAIGSQDRDDAFFYLQKASEFGDAAARYLLGRYYESFYSKEDQEKDKSWIVNTNDSDVVDPDNQYYMNPDFLIIAMAYYDGSGDGTDAKTRYEVIRHHLNIEHGLDLPEVRYANLADSSFPEGYRNKTRPDHIFQSGTDSNPFDPMSVNPVYVRTLKDPSEPGPLKSPMEVFRYNCRKDESTSGAQETVTHLSEAADLAPGDNVGKGIQEMSFSDFAFKTGPNGEKTINIIGSGRGNPEVNPYNEPHIDIGFGPQPGYDHDIPPGEAQDRLDALVGLTHVKNQIRTFENRILYEEKRAQSGLKKADIDAHFLFLGAPGTGKTTVARILGALLRDKGYLKKGHVVEVERSQLIGEYVGWTAPKVKELFMSALDGVLFIDEAYNLFNNHHESVGGFEDEAVSTLLKLMEDYRDRIVVVLAGYTEEMQWLIRSNSGLQSRFPFTIEFGSYQADELSHMFEKMCDENDYTLSEDARERVTALMQQALDKKGPNFGQGRFVRHAFNRTIDKIANRMAGDFDLGSDSTVDQEKLSTVLPLDIPGLEDIDAVAAESSSAENNVVPLKPRDDS